LLRREVSTSALADLGGRVTRSDEERFADILSAIDRCQNYEQYVRSDEFGSMAYDAVLRNLGVIGEAVRALATETRDAMPDVPWASIAGHATSSSTSTSA
jgi:uncharacterized protein with HEPN domain